MVDEQMFMSADLDIDQMVTKFERMNNSLRDVRIRRPTKYDQVIEERRK